MTSPVSLLEQDPGSTIWRFDLGVSMWASRGSARIVPAHGGVRRKKVPLGLLNNPVP